MVSIKKFNRGVMRILFVSVFLLFFSGCMQMFLGGGELVSDNYEPQKVIVSYRGEGTLPAGVNYFLIEDEEGLAIFEQMDDGSGTLFQTRWQDSQGDHFCAWVKGNTGSSHAYEFIVPTDRSKTAKKYVYPAGTWDTRKVNGMTRLVPDDPDVEHVATLIPK